MSIISTTRISWGCQSAVMESEVFLLYYSEGYFISGPKIVNGELCTAHNCSNEEAGTVIVVFEGDDE